MSRRSFVCFAACLAAGSAHAWEHSLRVWESESMPIPYVVADDAEVVEAIDAAFTAWHSADCAAFEAVYSGVGYNGPFAFDGINTVSVLDPGEALEAGVLAATYVYTAGVAFVVNGQVYEAAADADIVFNDNTDFVSHADVLAGTCDEGYDLTAVAAHEVGHLLGLDHPCGPSEACTEIEADATMYWDVAACDPGSAAINADDIDGLTALYGPRVDFACSHETSDASAVGVVPFTLQCVVDTSDLDQVDSVVWDFGDGGSGEGAQVSHIYEVEGQYPVTARILGGTGACDDYDATVTKTGYVRACDVPAPIFEMRQVLGLKWIAHNQTGVPVYGCHDDILWEIYEGKGTTGEPVLSFSSWEPEFSFPDEGTYTIIVNIGGPAGTGAAKVTLDVKKTSGIHPLGCATIGSDGLALWWAWLPLLAVFRRR